MFTTQPYDNSVMVAPSLLTSCIWNLLNNLSLCNFSIDLSPSIWIYAQEGKSPFHGLAVQNLLRLKIPSSLKKNKNYSSFALVIYTLRNSETQNIIQLQK